MIGMSNNYGSSVKVNKKMRPVVEEAVSNGWTVEYTKNGHLRFTHPCGALVYGPSTPSDPRGLKNLAATLRREYAINTNKRSMKA